AAVGRAGAARHRGRRRLDRVLAYRRDRFGFRRVERRFGDLWRDVVSGGCVRSVVPSAVVCPPGGPAAVAEEARAMTGRRYFEDFAIGQKFASEPQTIDTEAIKAFAAQFDPQPFHLDEEAARHSPLVGLVASGWHSAAVGGGSFRTSCYCCRRPRPPPPPPHP